MADFRIQLPDGPDELARRELDWDRDSGDWTVSEQEYGSSRWNMRLPATAWDLGQILVFFRIIDPVSEEALARMTPGECVMAHFAQTGTKDLLADLCHECGEHWLVYRLEDGGTWRLYGRNCNFAWYRGRAVDPLDDVLLARLLTGTAIS